jgi:hypothetical protein
MNMFYKKICNIAISLTSIAVFLIWASLYDIDLSYFKNSCVQYLIKTLIGLVFAFGFFKMLVFAIIFLIEKSSRFKRCVFDSSYFEGIWVGYYIAPIDGRHVIFYQIIEQTTEHIQISVQAYHADDRSYRGNWKSIHMVFINPKEARLIYSYEFTGISQNEQPVSRGLFEADFQKDAKKIPCRIEGNAFNFITKMRFKMDIKKESNNPVIENNDNKKLLDAAYEFYKNSRIPPPST